MKKHKLMLLLACLASPAHAQSTLFVDSTSGHVGIGTTSPSTSLYIYNSSGQAGLTLDGSANPFINIDYGSVNKGVIGVASASGNFSTVAVAGDEIIRTAGGRILFDTNDGTGTPALTILGNNGKVGIGTTSPSTSLYIYNSSGQAGLTLDGSANPFINIDYGSVNKGVIGVASASGNFSTAAAAGDEVFRTAGGRMLFDTNNGTGTPALTILGANGNIGFGTTSPASLLDVNGWGRILRTTGSAPSSGAGLELYYLTSDAFGSVLAYDRGSSSYLPLHLRGSSVTIAPNDTPVVTALSSGNVGIGTTTPSYTLHVNGSVAGTSAYVNLSDERYKKNITPLNAGLSEVILLKPVTFEWKLAKDAGTKGQQIGFIAQDMEKVLPSAVVTEDNKEKTKGIKYTDLIPVLTKAIQELKAENDSQAKALAELSHKFDTYKAAHP